MSSMGLGLSPLMLPALLLGAAHALEPGHGKTLLSMHFSVSQDRLKEGLVLCGLMTLLHAVSLSVYGALGVFLARTVAQVSASANLFQLSGVLAGLGILGCGVFWAKQAWQPVPIVAVPSLQGVEPRLQATVAHDHAPCCDHAHAPLPSARTWQTEGKAAFSRQMVLSVISSLVPCPSAVVVVMAMLTMGGAARLWDAMMFLGVFSFGLALTLVLAGALLSVPSRKLAQAASLKQSLLPLLRKASAVAMLVLGGFILVRSVWWPAGAEPEEVKALLGVLGL
jgi:nickel/cobalt transporter (NicO) family protein